MRILRAGTSNNSGFTLLELIVVIFIVAIVMSVAFPAFVGFGEGKLKSEAREMASILRYLNDSAISRKETFLMRFKLDRNMVSWSGPEGERGKKFEGMTGVTTQSTGLVSKGEVTIFFEPLGLRENLSVHLNRGNKSLTVRLEHLSGKVKIKDTQ